MADIDRDSIGPGKIALPEAIRRQESIYAAVRHLGMSYRRAWLLVEQINKPCRGLPLRLGPAEPLALGCEAMRLQGMQKMQPLPNGAIPLPLTAINIGEGNQTFLMLQVGAAALMFGMSSAVPEEFAQTLLALSACRSVRPT